MRLTNPLALAACFSSIVESQWTPVKYYEASSGITYSQVSFGNGATYRIAFPPLNTASEAIIQIVAPVNLGWCAFAWGGRMTNNPLSVAWPTKQSTGQAAIFSSRIATNYSAVPAPSQIHFHMPLALSPSKANATHWTATARCLGCTRWTGSGGVATNLDAKDGETRFSYACSSDAVTTPSSNMSTFKAHDSPGGWQHDLRGARNASYTQWVGGNATLLGKFY